METSDDKSVIDEGLPQSGDNVGLSTQGPKSLPGANRAAFLLMLAYMLSFIDRQVLVLMIEPMQRDLGINDTMFSLLHGTSFALFYAFSGIFIGRLMDRGNRVRLIVWAISIWSFATVLCGVARGYVQLFGARMMVGVGEAGLSPGAYSLLSDYNEPRKRSNAFAIYSAGIYLGSGMAFVLGGRLIQYLETIPPIDLPLLGATESWRMTFLIVGVPGFILAMIIKWLIAEPERGIQEKLAAAASPETAPVAPPPRSDSFADFFRFVKTKWQPYLCHNLGFGLHMMYSFALSAWIPALLMRNYGWEVGDVGMAIGLQYLTIGGGSVVLGGYIARWWREHGEPASEVTIGALSCVALLISVVVLVMFPSSTVAITVSGVTILFKALPSGLNASSLQIVAPPRYRGQSGALFLLLGSLLGLALGPLIVAMITDFFFADKTMIASSLLVLGCIIMPISITLLLMGRKYFRIEPQSKTEEALA